MITDVEDFFTRGCGRCARFDTLDCSALLWAEEIAALRRLCLGAGLEETVKWGHPCYRHAGRNIALIGAFRGDVRMSFFNAALLSDPEGLLQRSGPHTRSPDVIRFDGTEAVTARAATLRAWLAEAMGHAEQGLRPPPPEGEAEPPEELTEALDADPELAEAFAALTPGRRRSYVIALSGAKKPETRIARIAKLRPKILAGKGATER